MFLTFIPDSLDFQIFHVLEKENFDDYHFWRVRGLTPLAFDQYRITSGNILRISSRFKKKLILKNPAYGRQSISQPMRIVAPIPQ